MRRLGIWIFLLMVFASFAVFPAKADTDPFSIVKDVVEHQKGIVYEGVKFLAHWWGSQLTVQAVHVFKAKDGERFEYFPFEQHPFQEVIINGKEIYYIKPSKNLIFHSSFEYHGPKEADILNLADQNYDWNDEGTDTIAGFETRIIAAVPKGGTQPLLRFWVSEKHHAILREERYNTESGKLVFASYFSWIVFPKNLPVSFFQPPPLARIRSFPSPVELEGEKALAAFKFKPLIPRFVPKGFHLVGTFLMEWRQNRKLQFLYSDGLRDFSIYESLRHGPYRNLSGSRSKVVNGRTVELLQRPEGELIRFADGPLTIAVMGAINEKNLLKLAVGGSSPSAAESSGTFRQMEHYFARGLLAIRHLIGFNF